MHKTMLLMAGLVLLFPMAARTDIVVDGDISDWNPAWIYDDTLDPKRNNNGEAQMQRWGAVVMNGYLYGFFEMSKDISIYASGTNDIWAGLWIDADNQGGPGNTPSSLAHTPGQLGGEWDGVFEGFDILAEWGVNTGHGGEGFNFWGEDDDAWNQGSAIVGGQTAYAGKIIEFSVPISEILAELARYPDNITPNMAMWSIGARVEASIGGVGPWGGDNSDVIAQVGIPEPSTWTLLLLGLGALPLLRRRPRT